MRRVTRKIARRVMMVSFLCLFAISCQDAGEEIFENIDLQTEQATDEEDEKKIKPKKE